MVGTVKAPNGKRTVRIDPVAVEACFETWKKLDPKPTTELVYGNAFQLLIAVVLSAQATDKGVNKATAGLFETVKTPQQMVALGLEGLRAHVKTLNFFNNKAKNVMALAEKLVVEFDGEVPLKREALESLPGVGRKTANVILNTLAGEHVIAVDTHVFRLTKRLGWSKGMTVEEVEEDLMRIVPEKYMQHAHHWLILHGRYICVARAPKCAVCPVSQWCPKVGVVTT